MNATNALLFLCVLTFTIGLLERKYFPKNKTTALTTIIITVLLPLIVLFAILTIVER